MIVLTTTSHQQSNAAPHNNWPKSFLAHTLCLFQSNFNNWISIYKTLVIGYQNAQPAFELQDQILVGPFLCPSLSQISIAARFCQKDPRTPWWWNIIGQGHWNVGHWSLPGSWLHSWNSHRRDSWKVEQLILGALNTSPKHLIFDAWLKADGSFFLIWMTSVSTRLPVCPVPSM